MTLLTPSGGHQNTYGWQAVSTHPTVMLSCYRPQRSWGKVMFSQACVILFTEGCLPQCMLGYHTPPWDQAPPGTDTPRTRHPRPGTPREQTPHLDQAPPGAGTPQQQTPPVQSMLRDMVNTRVVRILLECNLVVYISTNATVYPQLCRGIMWIHRSLSTPRQFHKGDSRSH